MFEWLNVYTNLQLEVSANFVLYVWEMHLNWMKAGNRSVVVFGMNHVNIAVSSNTTSWFNQDLFHEAPFMALAERMWAGVQLHHKFP